MHLRVILGLIGQLIAVPAALLLVPTSCPQLHNHTNDNRRDASCADAASVDDMISLKTTEEDIPSVPERLSSTIGAAARGSKGASIAMERRRGLDGRQREAGGGGDDGAEEETDGVRRSGLGQLKSGFEDAAEGVKEALNKLTNPLHELPRRAGDAFFSLTGRMPEVQVPVESESSSRYLEELRMAQESAERALGMPGWEEVARRSGVTVWKKYFPKDEYGHQYPCVKARAVISGSAEDVMGMIVDSTRVLEYNRYSKGRTDIEHLGPNTKIVWNKAQPPLSKKLHDFCTLMHMESLEDGAFMMITRATEHPHAPLLDGHVRSEILLGVTILRPAEGDPSRTEMTTVNHIVSNGVPVMIADRVSTKNAIDFIQNVEAAALASANGQRNTAAPTRG